MYKVGDRFIIEIEEVFTGKATGYPQYRIKGYAVCIRQVDIFHK